MNILYFSNSYSMQGGAELNLLRICKHFNQMNNVNVMVVLPEKKDIYFRYLEENINVVTINSVRPSFSGGVRNIIKFFINLPVTIWKLRRLIKKNNIDVVHANDIIDFPVLIAAIKTKTKVYAHIRFIFDKETIYTRFIKQLYVSCTDKIICVSKAVKNRWFPSENKAVVIYNGGPELDEYKRSPNQKKKKFTIVSVGKLVNITGHENLIEGVGMLPDYVKNNIQVIIVGGSAEGHENYEKSLKESVRVKGLENIVSFVGYQQNVVKFLDEADIFCFMTTWNHSFPTVVLEAEAMELPIIAFEKGGIPEQISDGENGYLVKDNKELANKIELFYNDRELLNTFSKNSREVLKRRFSLEKHFGELEKIYEGKECEGSVQ